MVSFPPSSPHRSLLGVESNSDQPPNSARALYACAYGLAGPETGCAGKESIAVQVPVHLAQPVLQL